MVSLRSGRTVSGEGVEPAAAAGRRVTTSSQQGGATSKATRSSGTSRRANPAAAAPALSDLPEQAEDAHEEQPPPSASRPKRSRRAAALTAAEAAAEPLPLLAELHAASPPDTGGKQAAHDQGMVEAAATALPDDSEQHSEAEGSDMGLLERERGACSPSPQPRKRLRLGADTVMLPAGGNNKRGSRLLRFLRASLVIGVLLTAGVAVLAANPQLKHSLQAPLDDAAAAFAAKHPATAAQLQQQWIAFMQATAPAQDWVMGAYASAAATLAPHWHQLAQQLQQLLRPGPSAADKLLWDARWEPSVLETVLPPGEHWREVAEDMSEVLRREGPARNKATAILAHCDTGHAWDCLALKTRLAATTGVDEACLLTLTAGSMSAGHDTTAEAALLQAALAPFLRRCPCGTVIIHDTRALPLGAVNALNNALSELGGFQYGGFVPAHQATFILTAPHALAPLLEQPDSESGHFARDRLPHRLKTAFMAHLHERVQERQQHPDDRISKPAREVLPLSLPALQRRIDFAIPLRMTPQQ